MKTTSRFQTDITIKTLLIRWQFCTNRIQIGGMEFATKDWEVGIDAQATSTSVRLSPNLMIGNAVLQQGYWEHDKEESGEITVNGLDPETEHTFKYVAKVGYEWRRDDAPEGLQSQKVMCPVVDGILTGVLNNVNPAVYYKYRPFYVSNSTWQNPGCICPSKGVYILKVNTGTSVWTVKLM